MRWFCARAKPSQEHIALENLARQDFIAYFPRITVERAKAGRIVRESEGLFPGYVLVRFALEVAAWRAINSTRGIVRLLGAGEYSTPIPLPVGEIERLQEREKRGELYISEVIRLRRGDEVRIKFGWAVDQLGTVLWTRGERIALLVGLLGREVRVWAPAHALDLVRRGPAGRPRDRVGQTPVGFGQDHLPAFLHKPITRPSAQHAASQRRQHF